MPLAPFHPVVRDWFTRRFGDATEAQRRGWPAIMRGRDTLIAAPTGSGKTLAAFLWCLDTLLRKAFEQRLADETEVLYVSPLRALSNDVEKNLAGPLAELERDAAARLLGVPSLRVAVRTGDTPAAERQKMAKRPPHVLITTPESLYILLTAARSRAALSSVKTVIVDEIHALAGNKRGAHLALSLERLDAIVRAKGGPRPTRIGLSATQKPIEEVARFLVGTDHVDGEGRPDCEIVDASRARRIDLAVETPKEDELSAVASAEAWGEVYDRVAALVKEHRSTLVFCNTRRQVERAAGALGERLGDAEVAAHHGSLSKKTRLEAEQKLKENRVRCVVATASLELGIDVGAVDLVVQLGSPRSLSVLVQRVGRSGHWRGGVPKGRLFATTRDELVECAALVRATRQGELDAVAVRREPLDILAQQIVAEVAAEDWAVDELYQLVRRAWPYARLERRRFDQVLDMLAEGIAARRGRAGALVHHDQVNERVRGRRGARLAAITAGGPIPDNADYAVIAEPEGVRVGTVDEDFAVESMRGDIFQLGNTSWRVRRVEAGTLRVEDALGAPPTIPFWNGEAPGRSVEASRAVSEVRQAIDRFLDDGDAEGAVRWLVAECGLDEAAARQAVRYVAAGKAALGAVPTQETLVAERFFDEAGGMQLVLHAPFGGRTNRAWGLALRKRFCRSFNFELQAAATDDGIVISLGPHHSFPLADVFRFLSAATVEHVLTQALLGAPMFPTRWRWTATRSLAVLRSRGGKRVPPPIQRMRSEDLLAAVFPDQLACPENTGGGDVELPDHPLVVETVSDCTTEPLDLRGLVALIGRIESGQVTLLARDTAEASPFSHAILNAAPYAYLDDAPLEERRTRAVMTRRQLPESASDLGALDPSAIEETIGDAWPAMRDADEVHDALLGLGVLPATEATAPVVERLAQLVAAGRATRILIADGDGATRAHWVAAERLALARAAFPDGRLDESLPALTLPERLLRRADEPGPEASTPSARGAIVRSWMDVVGPTTAAELGARLGLPTEEVDAALLALESEGGVLRGRFRPLASSARVPTSPSLREESAAGQGAADRAPPGRSLPDLEWCDRRLLARIHSLTLGRLRKEIAPVTAADLMRFLFRWQHVAPQTQLAGSRGLAEVIGQLQGIELAAAAWEREVLPRRIDRYEPGWLDELCWRGEVAWGRLAPRGGDGSRPAQTSRAAPLAIVRREDLDWLAAAARQSAGDAASSPATGDGALSHAAQAVRDHLARRGASFFDDLVRGTRRLPTEIATALGELVAAGVVTADSFAALRALFGKPRAERPGSGRSRRPPAFLPFARRHTSTDSPLARATGRWSLLTSGDPLDGPPPHGAPTLVPSASPDGGSRLLDDGVPRGERAVGGGSLGSAERGGTGTSPPVRAAQARQLLRRYGVVFRDLLERERGAPWRELLPIYRRMEARGELRGGRFVAGFVGEQFALPEAVEALRETRRGAPVEGAPPELVILAATDPLNLVGILTPGPRVPSFAGSSILFRNGAPIASREGGELVRRAPLEGDDLLRAARLLDPAHAAAMAREEAEGYSVDDSEGGAAS